MPKRLESLFDAEAGMSFIVKRGRVVSVVDCSVWVGTVVVLDMPKISTQGFEFEYTVRIVRSRRSPRLELRSPEFRSAVE